MVDNGLSPGGRAPYYDDGAAANNRNLLDAPGRFDHTGDPHFWTADLYLVTGPAANTPGQVTIYGGIQWGWVNDLPALPVDQNGGVSRGAGGDLANRQLALAAALSESNWLHEPLAEWGVATQAIAGRPATPGMVLAGTVQTPAASRGAPAGPEAAAADLGFTALPQEDAGTVSSSRVQHEALIQTAPWPADFFGQDDLLGMR
jgi:hypothetical protein